MLQEHKESDTQAILKSPHGCPRDLVSKLIGQVNAYEAILDVEFFMRDTFREEKEDEARSV